MAFGLAKKFVSLIKPGLKNFGVNITWGIRLCLHVYLSV